MEYLREKLNDNVYNIIIVDDIMYYRSMRKDIYKIGYEYRVPMVIVHVNCPLDLALKRNQSRLGQARIPDEVR